MNHPKEILQFYNLPAKKSLGQNFLYDEAILTRIADSAEVGENDVVVEVGPGLGHLTEILAKRAKQVVAVELDDRLLPILQNRLGQHENVTIIHDDILEVDLDSVLGGVPYKVVANVPYYITAAILRHFLENSHPPTQVALTVQREVADRLSAEAGDMSLLAVSVQFFGTVKRVGIVKAGSFYPSPSIDSAIVLIDLRERQDWGVDTNVFFRVVKTGFSQKRKQLKNNFRGLGFGKSEISARMAEAGVAEQRRAETLNLSEWVAVTRAFFP
jgi:16S rRNA (adenine1518-N6/adenine1519-N6)-dimethyltransferase